MKDQFNKDYESTTKLDKNVEQLLKQRRELVAQNRPTGKVLLSPYYSYPYLSSNHLFLAFRLIQCYVDRWINLKLS
jgi:hypothetical protein